MAFNDHSDWRWDERVLQTVASLDAAFRRLSDQLTGCLACFGGCAERYSAALASAQAGQRA